MDDSDPTPTAPGAVLRAGARVLLIDEEDRVLLFCHPGGDGAPFWLPVGGGHEAGETLEETARREVLEETGSPAPAALVEFGYRRLVVPLDGQLTDIRETWFFGRTPHIDVDDAGWTELELATITDHRWWGVDEMRTATDRLVPSALADLVHQLLVDGPPETLLELGR